MPSRTNAHQAAPHYAASLSLLTSMGRLSFCDPLGKAVLESPLQDGDAPWALSSVRGGVVPIGGDASISNLHRCAYTEALLALV